MTIDCYLLPVRIILSLVMDHDYWLMRQPGSITDCIAHSSCMRSVRIVNTDQTRLAKIRKPQYNRLRIPSRLTTYKIYNTKTCQAGVSCVTNHYGFTLYARANPTQPDHQVWPR